MIEMEEEKEAMITSFEMSTRVLLERIKELETPNFGERPTTAQVYSNIR